MKVKHIAKSIAVFLMLGVFFYSTSIKELHYAFAAQYHGAIHHDNCDHHIHSSDKEGDCSICKLDVIGLFNLSESHHSFTVVFFPKRISVRPEEIIFSSSPIARHLRGPPQIA